MAKPGDSSAYDYATIPIGYYDRIFRGPKGIRKLWHVSKFERVLDVLPEENGGSLLDIGCFAGTFLSTVPRYRFDRQLGIDILPEQIDYANHHHSAPFREFRHASVQEVAAAGERFDCVTLIEVIEHLTREQVGSLLDAVHEVLKPGGRFVFSTPNYGSMWPLIEMALNRMSDVKYEEQHITRFSFFNLELQLQSLEPQIWNRFDLKVKTTTHFVTPFMAAVNYELARGLSRALPHGKWQHPAGNLILVVLEKRENERS